MSSGVQRAEGLWDPAPQENAQTESQDEDIIHRITYINTYLKER